MKQGTEAVILTEEKLQERLQYWQDRLGLKDWDIQAKISRLSAMRPDVAGTITWVLENRSASIDLLDPEDYPKDTGWCQDMEETLIHELLHLHFAPIHELCEPKEPYGTFEEWAIVAMSKAFIAMERGE